MTIEEIIKKQINELTDADINSINNDTTIEDIGLASLDFVAIQVAIKRELNIDIDLNNLAAANLITLGDLITYLEKNHNNPKN